MRNILILFFVLSTLLSFAQPVNYSLLPAGLQLGMDFKQAAAAIKGKGTFNEDDSSPKKYNAESPKTELQYDDVEFVGYKGSAMLYFTYGVLTNIEFKYNENDYNYNALLKGLQQNYSSEKSCTTDNEGYFKCTWFTKKMVVVYSGQNKPEDVLNKFKINFLNPQLKLKILGDTYAKNKVQLPVGLKMGMNFKQVANVMEGKGMFNNDEGLDPNKLDNASSEVDISYVNVMYNGFKNKINLNFTYGLLTEIEFFYNKGSFNYNSILKSLQADFGNNSACKDKAALKVHDYFNCEWEKEGIDIRFSGLDHPENEHHKFSINFEADDLQTQIRNEDDDLVPLSDFLKSKR